MATSINIKFIGFWHTFDVENNPITRALRASRQVSVIPATSAETPDILFYTCFDQGEHFAYDCLKVYYTGENDFPDFNVCDYALSFVPSNCGGRNMRYPLFMLMDEFDREAPVLNDDEALSRGFCSFVASATQNADRMRVVLPDFLETYKPLAYGGSFRNNVGGRVADKEAFISRYKFNLAVENSMADGYVTEKIVEPLCSATVPIYWGSREALKDFNPEAFIYAGDFNSQESLLNEVRRIDNDSNAYLAMLRAPKHLHELTMDYNTRLEEYLGGIAGRMERKIPRYGRTGIIMRNLELSEAIQRNRYLRWLLRKTLPVVYHR